MPPLRQAQVGATHRPAYLPALDGIRGIAIVWVVLHNTTALPFTSSSAALSLILQLGHPGWIGVQLFFALSGFLITAGLLETRGSAGYFRNFYAKRALRILPLYYAVLFVLLVVAPRLASEGANPLLHRRDHCRRRPGQPGAASHRQQEAFSDARAAAPSVAGTRRSWINRVTTRHTKCSKSF